MKSKVTKIKKLSNAPIPQGKYQASWSGYCVTLVCEHGTWELTTTVGVRGIVHCFVIVSEDGSAAINTEDPTTDKAG